MLLYERKEIEMLRNTERLNDEMFGKPSNNGGRVIVIILLAVLLGVIALIASVTSSHALEDGYTYETSPQIEYWDGFGDGYCLNPVTPLSMPNPNPLPCGKGESNEAKDTKSKTSNPVSVVIATQEVTPPQDDNNQVENPEVNPPSTNEDDTSIDDVPSTDNDTSNDEVTPPTNNPPTVSHEDKPKCNNGEGNGSEGCSPAKSDNANNDENQTSPKEDKSKGGK